MKPVQMLWVNLIMDTMGALALGTEMPKPELLQRKPYKRRAPLVSRPMIRNILSQSFYQLAVLFVFMYEGPELLGTNNGDQCVFVKEGASVCTQVSRERCTGSLFFYIYIIVFSPCCEWLVPQLNSSSHTPTNPGSPVFLLRRRLHSLHRHLQRVCLWPNFQLVQRPSIGDNWKASFSGS